MNLARKELKEEISKLTKEEKAYLKGYEDAIKDATNDAFVIGTTLEGQREGTVISTSMREIAEETIETIKEYMEGQYEDMAVTMIEAHIE